LLKEALARALDYRQPKRAKRALTEWLAWASRSRLRPFVRLARTVRQHRDGILAYVAYRLTNGVVEGINNRLRMIARRAFGFHGPKPLIAMLFLCCGGVALHPPLPRPS
jgi:transposase